ncbi:extensin-like [Oncorhynchus tshawytscha]|uniref:extensin-like n=1 Tax=Oncorhynchus tshawytscha TaxID=74940 RepID=UPI001C3E0381|nr:extensin-like [Oncorhynchus tshawytscha]
MASKVSKLDEQFKLDAPREKPKDGACSSIFTGVAIYVKGYTEPSVDELRRLMMLHGGQFHVYYSHSHTTHIIANNLPNSKIQELRDQKLVRPEWITDSIKAGHLLSYLQYQLYAKQKGLSFPSVSVHQGQEPAGPLHGRHLPSHSLNNHNPAPSLGQPLPRHHTPTSSHSHLHTDNLHPQPKHYNPLASHRSPQPSHSLPSHLNPQPSHSLPSHLSPQPSHLSPQPRHLTLRPSLLSPFSSNHLYSDPGHITHHPPSHGQPKLGCIQPPSAYTHPQTPGPVPANPSHEHSKPGQAQPPSILCISSHLQHSYRELDFRLNGSLLTSYEKTRSVKMNWVQELGGEDPCPVKTPRGVKDPTLTNGHTHPVNGAINPLDLSPNPTRHTPTPDRGLLHTLQSIPSQPDSPLSKPPIQHDTPRPPPVSHHRHHAQLANEQRPKPPPPTYQEAMAASASRPLDLPSQSDFPPEKPLPLANPNPSPSPVCLNGSHHNVFPSNPTPWKPTAYQPTLFLLTPPP